MTTFASLIKTLTLSTGKQVYYYSLPDLEKQGHPAIASFPFSVKVLLESLIRLQGHPAYKPEHVTAFAAWDPKV